MHILLYTDDPSKFFEAIKLYETGQGEGAGAVISAPRLWEIPYPALITYWLFALLAAGISLSRTTRFESFVTFDHTNVLFLWNFAYYPSLHNQ